MVDIRHIVCPIDFSETSRHALEHAVVLAKWYESRLTALHVMHAPLFPNPPIFIAAFADTATPGALERAECEDQLAEWLEPARRSGVASDVIVTSGSNPAREILAQAGRLACDVIVMGTHGLSGFDRLILGSICEKVVRKASCPVLTVPPAAVTARNVPYARLLCAVDFSESSIDALRYAASLAKEADARLTILHVFDWSFDDELLVERFDAPEFRRVVESALGERLEALVTDDLRTWANPSTRIEYGKAYRRILEVAADEKTDLIVMGVRGRNPVDLALFGSTTNHVVRRAPCPVLTLRAARR